MNRRTLVFLACKPATTPATRSISMMPCMHARITIVGNTGNIYICCQDTDKKKIDRDEKYKRTYPPDSPGSLRVTVFEKRR